MTTAEMKGRSGLNPVSQVGQNRLDLGIFRTSLVFQGSGRGHIKEACQPTGLSP